jgi:quercetin dioxygenase-like cupin family protein
MTDAILGNFHLHDEIARFTPGDSRSGRRAQTLIKTDRLRVVLVTMRAGAELQEHTAPGPITIQALLGRFSVSVASEEHDLAHGHLISIQTDVPHSVRAVEDGAFLLTISWLPDDTSDSAAMEQV